MPTKRNSKKSSKAGSKVGSKNIQKANEPHILPLGDKVLLAPVEMMSVTASGIILPDSVDTDKGMKEAKVVAVGPGKIDDGQRVPIDVKKGDVVFYQWGDDVKIDGKDYVLVSESNIVAVIK